LRFELAGFKPTDVTVRVGNKPVRVDAVLRVGALIHADEIVPLHQGEISGTVTAIEGVTLSGARVTLKGLDAVIGPETRTVQTRRNGKYAFGNLPRGTYIVGFEFVGYQPTYVKVNVRDKPVKVDPVLPVRFID
jgi:hypothetical protein